MHMNCCLWKADKIEKKKLINSLHTLEVIEQESHFTRKILECKNCGQVYLYEFTEEVDWEDGNDKQLFRWFPVESIYEAWKLAETPPIGLINHPAIRIDFSKDMQNPKGPYKYDPS